ncbi:hypothetical protein AX15_003067 [Amanita polypyramis BW_CC]|nr:hypothetical protein AX15_003067 [Amanita polypyramis BW_CC]
MPGFGIFHAGIKLGGEKLPEYNIQTDETEKKVSCWIPSEAGKNFSVCWSSTESIVDIGGWVKVDGTAIGGKVCHKGLTAEVDYSSCYTTPTTSHCFSFSAVAYTDDDTYLNAPIPNFGEIELEIYHVRSEEEVPVNWQGPLSHEGKVHERSKKMGAHCVQFGALQEAPHTNFFRTTKIRRLVTFFFRYRPLDMLQANGIAPLPARATSARPIRYNNKRKSPERDEVEIKDDPSEEEDIDQRMDKLKVRVAIGHIALRS